MDGTFWNIVAFSESTLSELMRLGEGEAMAVQGAMRIEEYDFMAERPQNPRPMV